MLENNMKNTKTKISSNWQSILLDSVTRRGTGHTPNKKKSHYWGGDIKWVSLKDSKKLDKFFISETDSCITPDGIKNSSAVVHKAGTVILSRDAGVGKSAILKENMAVSQHFMAWYCSERLNNIFLYHWLQVKKKRFELIAVGSTIKTIGVPYFKKLKILLPPIDEQNSIVTILETWDKSIDLLKQKIALKKQVKKGLMQRLLTGDVRLPGFSGEWITLKLNMLGDTHAGLSGKTKDDFGNGKPFISYMNIYSNPSLSINNLPLVDVQEGERQFTAKYGDLFFTTSSETPHEVGISSVLLNKHIDSLYLNSFCFAFRLNDFETILPEFAKYYFRGQIFRKSMTRIAQGASRYNLSKRYFVNTELVIPNISEQKEISVILQTSDNEINLLKQKLQILEQQKKFLLNNLVTGTIRTPEDMTVTA